MNKISIMKMFARVYIKKMIKISAALISKIIPSRLKTQNRVFVLMYHRVNSYRKDELSVSLDQFEKQVHWIHSQGFLNMRMSDLESHISSKSDIPHVIFTFDDGYEDNYTNAFPILKKYGYTGTFYITTAYIGTDRMFERDIKESNRPEYNKLMNWNQVREMLKEGMEIGSHTMNHSDLTRISLEEAKFEIIDSKQKMEEELRVKITSFCYPAGDYNKNCIRLVREAGYTSACTTVPGAWQGHDLLTIPRISVLSSDTFFVFKQKLSGNMEWFKLIH